MCSTILAIADLQSNYGEFNEDEWEKNILKRKKEIEKEKNIALLKQLGRPPLKRDCNINIFSIHREYEKIKFKDILLFHQGLNPKSITRKPKPIYNTKEITLDFVIKFHEGLNP